MIFKRKKTAETAVVQQETVAVTPAVAGDTRAQNGPFDVTEVPQIRPYIDMGSIKIAPRQGLKVRLDVEENSNRIMAISLDYAQSTLQVQAFAAPKSHGIWDSIREQIATSLNGQAANLQEVTGVFGMELLLTPGVDNPQASPIRFFGVDGPRWLLRGVLVGKAVTDPHAAKQIEEVFREIVVVRGEAPMPPEQLLPLQMPAGLAQTVQSENE